MTIDVEKLTSQKFLTPKCALRVYGSWVVTVHNLVNPIPILPIDLPRDHPLIIEAGKQLIKYTTTLYELQPFHCSQLGDYWSYVECKTYPGFGLSGASKHNQYDAI